MPVPLERKFAGDISGEFVQDRISGFRGILKKNRDQLPASGTLMRGGPVGSGGGSECTLRGSTAASAAAAF